jgi:long-chain fatty acid transport protein
VRFSIETARLSLVTAALTFSFADGASAGGFEIQQSAYFQGMSFAGVATGGPSIASISWNPATSSFAGSGLTIESSYAFVTPQAQLTVTNPEAQLPPPGTDRVDIGRDSFLAASFSTARLNDRTVLGLSITAPFGLVTKPDDMNWAGKYEALTTKIFTINATPSVSYEVAPGVALGAGIQFQYFDLLELRAATPLGGSDINGDNFAVGGMAGINITPREGTSIGLGFRSSVDHHLEGDFKLRFNPTLIQLTGVDKVSLPVRAELETPDKITLSFRQVLSTRTRLLGTVDWANWSRFGEIPIRLETPFPPLNTGDSIAKVVFNWRDGWLFAVGGEYDWSPHLTLRTGVAYEISPVDGATTRLVQVPDSNHVWASVGASYRLGENISIDLAYSHGFYEDDAPFERLPAATLLQNVPPLVGEANVSADMVAVSWRWRWGGKPPALKE